MYFGKLSIKNNPVQMINKTSSDLVKKENLSENVCELKH